MYGGFLNRPLDKLEVTKLGKSVTFLRNPILYIKRADNFS